MRPPSRWFPSLFPRRTLCPRRGTSHEVVVIEVKFRISDFDDFQRGVYQCVQYRAVMEAQQQEGSGRRVRSLLVTETTLPADLVRTAKRLHIHHLQAAPGGASS